MIDVDLKKTVPGFALDVAFRNAEGVTALFGRSGSGKSMTLGLIAGLAQPDHGHVRIGDTTLVDTTARQRVPMHKRRVGLVFQDSQLFPHLSVRHNLLFGRWFALSRDGAVGFDAVVETLGIGALLDRRPTRLSGGERQRVAIGRALLAAPRLLLLDEPFAALDRQRKLEILPLIERLRDEFAIPIVFVSHALTEVVRLAATVVVMADGKVVASGDPATVLPSVREPGDERFGRASIVVATVGETDDPYGLVALNHPAGKLWLAGTAGPRGRAVRAIVHATDVSLAPATPGARDTLGALSIRSVLAGTISGVETEGPLAAVEIALVGGGTLVAMVTRRALDDLALRVGSPVNALIKTVALDEGTVAPE
jgi:molybdate transport system ATP-binding protein